MIAIVDYNIGNCGSIRNMLNRLNAPCVVTSDPDAIYEADKVILPGVGSFDSGMRNLDSLGLVPVLQSAVRDMHKPTLGICLGMQLMTNASEEGSLPGLGWIDGKALKFRIQDVDRSLRIPHMGWNIATPLRKSPLWVGLPEPSKFYFVHSFHVRCTSNDDVLATTEYGINFTSVFAHEHLYGVQFHPEKSHKYGMALLKNFALLV